MLQQPPPPPPPPPCWLSPCRSNIPGHVAPAPGCVAARQHDSKLRYFKNTETHSKSNVRTGPLKQWLRSQVTYLKGQFTSFACSSFYLVYVWVFPQFPPIVESFKRFLESGSGSSLRRTKTTRRPTFQVQMCFSFWVRGEDGQHVGDVLPPDRGTAWWARWRAAAGRIGWSWSETTVWTLCLDPWRESQEGLWASLCRSALRIEETDRQ